MNPRTVRVSGRQSPTVRHPAGAGMLRRAKVTKGWLNGDANDVQGPTNVEPFPQDDDKDSQGGGDDS